MKAPTELIHKDGQIYDPVTGRTVAIIPHYDPEDEQQQEVARLLAAAPEMFKALKDAREALVESYNHYKRPNFITIRNADAAINKAENP